MRAVLQLLLLPVLLAAQSTPDNAFAGWKLFDPGGKTLSYLGRPALYLERGIATKPDAQFADGAIDVDIAIHGHAGFAGVVFRGQTPTDYELIYVRTHRSRQWDALQYTPVIGNQEAWQLYTGTGYNGAAELPANRWLHMRIVVDGYTARVYIDHAAEPQLIVTDLKRSWARGAVGLWGRNGAASFSNFTVTPREGQPPAAISSPSVDRGIITRWSLSQSFDAEHVTSGQLPPGLTWEPVTAEPSGILNISRYRAKSAQRDTVFARTVLQAARATRVRLAFGYSDDVVLFVDGQPLFAGQSGYLLRDGSYLGTLTLGADSIWLELSAGRHEVVCAVTEAFGGWGLAARLDEAAGVTVPE